MALLDSLVTTAAGALSVTAGVLVGGIVTHRAQDRQWPRDTQLVAYQELINHYAKFTMTSAERMATDAAGTTTGASGARP